MEFKKAILYGEENKPIRPITTADRVMTLNGIPVSEALNINDAKINEILNNKLDINGGLLNGSLYGYDVIAVRKEEAKSFGIQSAPNLYGLVFPTERWLLSYDNDGNATMHTPVIVSGGHLTVHQSGENESRLEANSNAGGIYFYSQPTSDGLRGIASYNSSQVGKNVMSIDKDNNTYFYGRSDSANKVYTQSNNDWYINSNWDGTFFNTDAKSDSGGELPIRTSWARGLNPGRAGASFVFESDDSWILRQNNPWLAPSVLRLSLNNASGYTDSALVGVSDGNLHIESYPNHSLYLNYYHRGPVHLCGASDVQDNIGVHGGLHNMYVYDSAWNAQSVSYFQCFRQ